MKNETHQEALTWSFLIHLLIIIAVFTRLIPHPENFTSIGAVGLFAGAYLSSRLALLVPLLALIISDAVIGFYDPVVMFFVYLGLACSVLIGRVLLLQQISIIRLGGSAVISACAFFILSNFGMWASGYYSYTLDGLISCYLLAIPFFKNTFAGHLFYAFCLFGIYELLRTSLKRLPYQHSK